MQLDDVSASIHKVDNRAVQDMEYSSLLGRGLITLYDIDMICT